MKYETALDLSQIICEKHIKGICNTILNQYTKISKKNKELGLTPMVKSKDYDFYMADYGFIVFCIETFVREHNMILEKDEQKGIEIAKKIHRDYAIDHNENLSRNGAYLVDLLKYFSISFVSKKQKGFYLRVIFNETNHNFLLSMSSISINMESVSKIAMRSDVINMIARSTNEDLEYSTAGKSASVILKTVGKAAKIYQFWERENGFTELLTK